MTLPLSHAIPPISFYGLVKSVKGQGRKKWKVSLCFQRRSNPSSVAVIFAVVCISISAPKYASSAGSCVCWARRCLRCHQFSCCGPDSLMSHEGIVNHMDEGGKLEQNQLGFATRPWELLGLLCWCLGVEQGFYNALRAVGISIDASSYRTAHLRWVAESCGTMGFALVW